MKKVSQTSCMLLIRDVSIKPNLKIINLKPINPN